MPSKNDLCGDISVLKFVDAQPSEEPIHQKLIDGLTFHVLLGEMEEQIADRIIQHYNEFHPNDDALDEAVLWAIRKDWGLTCPAK